MERRKPLARRTALARGKKGLKRSALSSGDKPLEQRTPLTQGETPLKRSQMKPGRRKARDRSLAEREAMAQFGAVPLGQCRAPWCSNLATERHHVIRQQILERIAKTLGLPFAQVVWDRRWILGLCEGCHDEHTRRRRRVPGNVVPFQATVAARELDRALEEAAKPAIVTDELWREHPWGEGERAGR